LLWRKYAHGAELSLVTEEFDFLTGFNPGQEMADSINRYQPGHKSSASNTQGESLLMDAVDRPSPNLVQILRSTLRRLEQSTEFSSDDLALRELKHSVLRLIADLQLRKESKQETGNEQTGKAGHSAVTLIVRPRGKGRAA